MNGPGFELDICAHLTTPVGVTFAALIDHARIPEWVPLVTAVRVESDISTVRRYVKARGAPETCETIIVLEPPTRLVYRAHGDMLPFETHEASVELTATRTGCHIRWRHSGRRRPGLRARLGPVPRPSGQGKDGGPR